MKNILFVGFRSEFVLSELAIKLSESGDFSIFVERFERSIDLDFYRNLDNLILITSQHISIDSSSYKKFYPHAQYYIAPIELIIEIKPDKSIFVPHDWATPIEEKDLFFLHYFDFILFDGDLKYPVDNSKIVDCGNVKLVLKENINIPSLRGIYFVNNYPEFSKLYYARHRRLLIFLRVINLFKVYLKFHDEKELDKLENDLRNAGYLVIDKQLSATQLLARNVGVVIIDGYGSILEEVERSGKKALLTSLVKPDSFFIQETYMSKYQVRDFKFRNLLFRNQIQKNPGIQFFNVEKFLKILM